MAETLTLYKLPAVCCQHSRFTTTAGYLALCLISLDLNKGLCSVYESRHSVKKRLIQWQCNCSFQL
jgi:hypothetical protein